MKTTTDALLSGRVNLKQPEQGYRVSTDAVFLAASVDAKAGQKILDVGAGVGAAMLCLAARVPDCQVTGLEVQKPLAELAMENIVLNGFEGRADIKIGDIRDSPSDLESNSFHHVISNPPYFAYGEKAKSSQSFKATSFHEETANLQQWINFCTKMARPRGYVNIIYDTQRVDELVRLMSGSLKEIVIFPLWSKQGRAAKRVIIRGRKGVDSPACLSPGLIVHQDDGSYTTWAAAVLSNMEPLNLVADSHGI